MDMAAGKESTRGKSGKAEKRFKRGEVGLFVGNYRVSCSFGLERRFLKSVFKS